MADVVPITREMLRARRKRAQRAITVSSKRTTLGELRVLRDQADADLEALGDFFSPSVRGDCANVPRPCPHVSCKHHLFLDVSPRTSAIKLNFPDLEPGDLPADGSCSLDVADRGGAQLERVGELMNLTRERIRQAEVKALRRVKDAHGPLLEELAGNDRRPLGPTEARTLHGSWNDVPPTPTDEQEPEDERSQMLLRGLNARERDEAERFARTAATLVLAGWRPLGAWSRANELLALAEADDPMPVDLLPERAPARGPGLLGLVTPPERLVAPPPPSRIEALIPRERPVVDLTYDTDAAELLLEVDDDETSPPDRDRPARDPRPGRPAAPARARTARPARHPERVADAGQPAGGTRPAARVSVSRETPKKERPMFQDELLEVLGKVGNATSVELAQKTKRDSSFVATTLKTMLERGLVDRIGPKGAYSWQVGTGKASEEAAAEAPKQRRKPRASAKPRTNGHAKNGASKNGASSLFDQLAQQLMADHAAATEKLQRKLDALKVLAEDA